MLSWSIGMHGQPLKCRITELTRRDRSRIFVTVYGITQDEETDKATTVPIY